MGRIAAGCVVLVGLIGAASSDSWSLLVAEGPPLQGEMRNFKLYPEPKAMPDISFTSLQGEGTGLDKFRGKVVLLNLWATWCAPCVQEMPSLDRLQAQLGGEGLTVLALSSDRGGANVVEPFLGKLGLEQLPIYLDPKNTATRSLGAHGLPTTLLLDRDGRELGRIEGAAHWDGPAALAFLRYYLAAPRARDNDPLVKTSG